MTISVLQLPLPSRLPRPARGNAIAPEAARLRAARRWSSVSGSESGDVPPVRVVTFAGHGSVTALPAWTGWRGLSEFNGSFLGPDAA